MDNISRISNTQPAGMAGYKILATIPEDPLYWGDAECFAFDHAIADVKFFLDSGDYALVETYTRYPNHNDIPDDSSGVDGERHLVIFPAAIWQQYEAAMGTPQAGSDDGR